MPVFGIEFIEFITDNFECYWLTTHCKGNVEVAINYLSKYYDANSIIALKKVRGTCWQTLKTEAIDFNSNFYWIDDFPFESEKEQLKLNNAIDRLITVNLSKENELENIKSMLIKLSFERLNR